MKTYEVTRTGSGQIGVLVKTDNGHNATLLAHCVVHSPTGFETGYAGSGPADLALSILADYLGVTPERIGKIWKGAWSWNQDNDPEAAKALRLHQDFKAHFITPRRLERGHSYEILGAHIASWLGNDELRTARAASR